MNLPGLLNFLINVVGLIIVVALILVALDILGAMFNAAVKQIARYAILGAALLAFLIYVAGLLGAGGGALLHVTPASIIEFAIGLIVLVILLKIIEAVVRWLSPDATVLEIINTVVGGIAIIVILVLAEKALFGGGLGVINFDLGKLNQKQGALPLAPNFLLPG
jgi:hypothetical protein